MSLFKRPENFLEIPDHIVKYHTVMLTSKVKYFEGKQASKQAFDFFYFSNSHVIVSKCWDDQNVKKLEKQEKHTVKLKNPLISYL